MKRLILIGMVLALLVGIFFAGKYYATRLVDVKVRDMVNKVAQKTKTDIDYKSLDINILDTELSVNNVTLSLFKGRAFDIDQIIVHDGDIRHPRRPRYLNLSVRGVTIPVNAANFGSHYKELNELGYTVIKADINLDYKFDPAKKHIKLNWFEIDIPSLGHFRIRLDIAGVDPDALRAAIAQKKLGGVFDHMVLEDISFAYDDKSLLRKLVEITTVEEKESIRFLVDGLHADIEKAKANGNDKAAATMGEVIEFLQSPGALSVAVERKEPLDLGNLDKYKKVSNFMKLFTINVTAGPEDASHE